MPVNAFRQREHSRLFWLNGLGFFLYIFLIHTMLLAEYFLLKLGMSLKVKIKLFHSVTPLPPPFSFFPVNLTFQKISMPFHAVRYVDYAQFSSELCT